jgi:DNA modification methylase
MSMKPFEWNHFYIMDCIYGMKQLPDKCFDLCLSDPPFNVGIGSSGNRKRATKNGRKEIYYDDSMSKEDYEKWTVEWFSEAKRLCKMILITPGKKNENMWIRMEEPVDKLYNYKPNSTSPGHLTMSVCMDVILAYGEWEHLQAFPTDCYYQKARVTEDVIHPCPKNYDFWRWMLRDACKKNKIKSVFDPFLGSGTTAQAAEELGLNWLGFEINQEYVNAITRRISLGIQLRGKVLKSKTRIDDIIKVTSE